MKNIVVITGSPRKGGNTDLLAEAFREGAEGAGHKVDVFNAAEKLTKPCIACDQCYKNGVPCAHEPAFNELAALIEKGDVVVFATPLYFSDFSAQMKLAIDHLYGMGGSNHKLEHVKESVLIVDSMSPAASSKVLCAVYQQFTGHLGWKVAGQLIVGGMLEKGSAKKTGDLDKARKLGASL
jgi:multimeric flavodoxin WrbA